MASLTCTHCLITFPERDAVYAETEKEMVFCCNGCRGIYLLLRKEGLENFYSRRKWDESGLPKAALEGEIDSAPFLERVTEHGGMCELSLYIEGIRCASCVWLNEKILGRTNGVSYARVNYATHRASIRWDPARTGIESVLGRIRSIGYIPKPYSETEQFRAQKAESRDLLIRFGTAGFLSSQLMVFSIALYAGYFQGIDEKTRSILEIISMILTIPVIFYAGMPFIRSTIKGLRHLRFTMDSLIAIGAGSAFLYSIYEMFTGGKVYFDTAAMIITLILLGRYIESTAKGRASEAVAKLHELSPAEARVVATGEDIGRMVRLDRIRKDDLVRVVPGEKIPFDGEVVKGETETDEAFMTGESKPVRKFPGSPVTGGSINLHGTVTLRVTRTLGERTLDRIIEAVEGAQATRPAIQNLADRVVGIFVPAILILAAATFSYYLLTGQPAHKAIMTSVSVLVIACPCSLGLATPLAVLILSGMLSSKGILIRKGDVIETASRTTTVALDKTGTITVGRPSLKEVMLCDPSLSRERALMLASSLERLSEHSIGRAITDACTERALNVDGFRAISGKGVEGIVGGRRIVIGSGNFMMENGLSPANGWDHFGEKMRHYEELGESIVYMGWEDAIRAAFRISDKIRDEALFAVERLRELQVKPVLVSGDRTATTAAIASSAGIQESIAEATPFRKQAIISELRGRGGVVMMVGDGINDAPALISANTGVAMGRGTDIAMESADAVLLGNDLRLIPYLISMSRKSYAIIKQNIFWSFFYNIVAVPLAVAGMLHPIVAAGAMAASSLFVVGNSLRIRRGGGEEFR